MRILQVFISDLGGGAERVATSLHEYYLGKGYDSKLLVGSKKGDDPNTISLDEFRISLERTRKLLGKIPRNLGIEYLYSPKFKTWLARNPTWDIIHFHNIHSGYLPLNSPSVASTKSHVVLSLHDRWPITGHCAQPINCDKWRANCFKCPDLSIYPKIKFDAAWMNLVRKKMAFNNKGIYLICPSYWMSRILSKSILSELNRTVIHNGVDEGSFCPGDKVEARKKLGLPTEGKYALYVANRGLDSPWRHGWIVTEFAEQSDDDTTTLVLGGDEYKREGKIIFIPYVKNELGRYYQASNIFLFPAIEDNFPLVLLECQASGLPVITTDVAGCPEIVDDGVSGYVVEKGDGKNFIQKANSLIRSEETQELFAENCLKKFKQSFRFETMAQKHISLYEKIMGL